MVGEDNKQISIVLPKEIVNKLELLAKEKCRTRSQQAAKIIIDYLNNIESQK